MRSDSHEAHRPFPAELLAGLGVGGRIHELARYESDPEDHLEPELADALLKVTERLPEWQPVWNTFGDGLYELEAVVAEHGDRLREELGEARYALVVDRMEAAIAADR